VKSDLPVTPSFRLDGRSALVTGASRGIGLAAAVALAGAGANVVLAARSVDDLAQAADAINERCKEQSAKAENGSQGLDGSQGLSGTVMSINLRGAYRMAQLVARKMIAEDTRGSIITTSSQMGHIGGIDRSVYCASKFAVEGWTRALAIEVGKQGIRVNTICPTFIRTPLTESTLADPERLDWIMSKIKLDRLGEIEDIMGSIVFLASDASALITGSSLMIDGGWTAG